MLQIPPIMYAYNVILVRLVKLILLILIFVYHALTGNIYIIIYANHHVHLDIMKKLPELINAYSVLLDV